jgi:hypothetical protein
VIPFLKNAAAGEEARRFSLNVMLRAKTSRGVDACQFYAHAARTRRAGWALAGGVGRFFLILAAMAGMENNSKMFGAS